ncbi:MAG: hypothetical protein Q4F41_00200 [Eubacteriales bacterium]|nr:hypothetical protein [Eubacteriales bacterium]
MSENVKKCPVCPRECDLSAPHCKRGEEYARTGKIPEERGGHGPRLQFEKKEQQLIMKYLHHAVGAADNGGITQEQAGEMFSVLTEEETFRLEELLERLADHWMKLAPNAFPHSKH